MTKITFYHKTLPYVTLVAALSAGVGMTPVQALAAQEAGLAANTVNMPLIIQMRSNINLAPALLSSMSKKAGTPLQVTRQFGTGTYLVRPSRPATAQGLRSIAAKLATHPNVLDAHLYQQSAPAYMIAPAGHPVTLNGVRLAGTTSPIASYRWHQITGANTGLPNSAQPNVTFMARQTANPGTAVSDPSAINPGDLSAPPQTFDCAISAASVHRSALTAPVLVSKNAFMCNPNGSSSASPPAAGSPPADSSVPGAGLPPASSGNPAVGTPSDSTNPSAGLPPVDTANPSSGLPPGSGNFPVSGNPGIPQDTFAPRPEPLIRRQVPVPPSGEAQAGVDCRHVMANVRMRCWCRVGNVQVIALALNLMEPPILAGAVRAIATAQLVDTVMASAPAYRPTVYASLAPGGQPISLATA